MNITLNAVGAKLTDEETSKSVRVRHNIDLSGVRGGFDKFSSEAFFSCTCISRRIKSSNFARIKGRQSERSIGWFIPSLYYSEPEQFSEVKFLSDFAYAAYLQFWIDPKLEGTRNQIIDRVSFDEIEVDFSGIIPEEVGFLVISKEYFKKERMDIADLKISMLQNGIWPHEGSTDLHQLTGAAMMGLTAHQPEAGNNIRVQRLPVACKSVGALISSVFSMAHEEFSGIGGFLYLYQIAEHLIEVNFSSLINHISNQNLPAWKLKKKLSDATSESYRLRNVARRAAENGARIAVFDALSLECKAFLSACGVEQDENERMWTDWVYAVRNVIVHNNLVVLRSGATGRLKDINPLLHRSVLELVLHY